MVTKDPGDRPWSRIDPTIAAVLRPTLPALIDRTLADIAHELPALGQDLAGTYGVALREGIQEALEHFLTLLGHDVPALEGTLTDLYRSFGAREDRHGRSMETLLAAYRRGSRGAWAFFSQASVAADLPTDQVIRLAEAIFAYVEELSSASALGFAQAHVERAGRRDLIRRQLAEAILKGEAETSAPRVADLAVEASWTMPDLLAAAVYPPAPPSAAGPIPHPDVLVVPGEDEVQAIIPAGLLRRHQARALWSGAMIRLAIGTIRPPGEAPTSLAHARATRHLVEEGVLPTEPVVLAAEHLPALLLHADRRLLADLSNRVLAPLNLLTDSRRELMSSTLRCWLSHCGDRTATARALGVHPQTVSYRMTELRRVFGSALDDPAARFALMLALEAQPASH